MSDNEDFMMSEEEEDPFEYEESDDEMASFEEDGDSGEGGGTEKQYLALENQYYSAKAVKEDDVHEALGLFGAIVAADISPEQVPRNVVWRFKSLKQSMKIRHQLGEHDQFLELYREILKLSAAISDKNYYVQSLDKIIDKYTQTSSVPFLTKFLGVSLQDQWKPLYNDKLIIKLYITKLNTLVLARKQGPASNVTESEIESLIEFVLHRCEQSSNDYIKQHNSLEVYAIQLNMLLLSPEIQTIRVLKKLRQIHAKCVEIEHTVILHPKILGVIKEAGGKILMIDKNYDKAIETLMESFKNYDEIGLVGDKLLVLKNLIILYLLHSRSEINILESNEIKPYLTKEGNNGDENIMNLLTLLNFYEADDIENFNRFFEQKLTKTFASDSFLNIFKTDILNAMKFRVITGFFKSFTTIRIDFLCGVLNIPDKYALEDLVFEMINNDLLTSDIRFNHTQNTILVSNKGKDKDKAALRFRELIDDTTSTADLVVSCSLLDHDTLSRYLGGKPSSVNTQLVKRIRAFLGWLKAALPAVSKEHLTQKDKVQLEKSRTLKVETGVPEPTTSASAVNTTTTTTTTNTNNSSASVSSTGKRGSTSARKLSMVTSLNVDGTGSTTFEIDVSITEKDKLSSILIKNFTKSAMTYHRSGKSSRAFENSARPKLEALNQWAVKASRHKEVIFSDRNLNYVPQLQSSEIAEGHKSTVS